MAKRGNDDATAPDIPARNIDRRFMILPPVALFGRRMSGSSIRRKAAGDFPRAGNRTLRKPIPSFV